MTASFPSKIRILVMLLLSIVATIFLHVHLDLPEHEQELTSPGQIDQSVARVIEQYSLEQVVEREETKVDSLFSRMMYKIEVPESFSKTSFHIDLQKQLNGYDIVIFGEADFPSGDLWLYVTYRRDLYRTIHLTDQNSTEK